MEEGHELPGGGGGEWGEGLGSCIRGKFLK